MGKARGKVIHSAENMRIIFVSIQHRSLPLFDEGIKHIKAEGYPVYILDNGTDNYDNGVVKLAEILKGMEWGIVHFIDNDCFISDTRYINKTLKDFEESELGFVSYFENGWGNDYHEYDFNGKSITEVKDQIFTREYPFMKPSWENAMMMFKREAFDRVTDWSDMNIYLPELWRKGVRFGVKKVEPALKYSHKGEGFIHVGNLMAYVYKMEGGEKIEVNEITKPRIGYLQKYHGLQGYPDFTKEWEDLCR